MRRAPWLAGIVVVAGNVRPLEQLIVEQSEYVASLGTLPAAQQSQLGALRKNPDRALASLPEKYRQDLDGYHRGSGKAEHADAHPAGSARLSGEHEGLRFVEAALAGRKNVTLRSYPDLNHLFETGEGRRTPAEYAKPGHMAGQLVEDIAARVQAEPGAC